MTIVKKYPWNHTRKKNQKAASCPTESACGDSELCDNYRSRKQKIVNNAYYSSTKLFNILVIKVVCTYNRSHLFLIYINDSTSLSVLHKIMLAYDTLDLDFSPVD